MLFTASTTVRTSSTVRISIDGRRKRITQTGQSHSSGHRSVHLLRQHKHWQQEEELWNENSRLDYCNALPARLLSCAVKRLQTIQNAAAQLVQQAQREPTSDLSYLPALATVCIWHQVLDKESCK